LQLVAHDFAPLRGEDPGAAQTFQGGAGRAVRSFLRRGGWTMSEILFCVP
jgi:hypothetical protein